LYYPTWGLLGNSPKKKKREKGKMGVGDAQNGGRKGRLLDECGG